MEKREVCLEEIKECVNNQGTLVQDDEFEQVPVHHLSTPLKIKDMNILYIGADAVYSVDGFNFRFSELSDDEIKTIYIAL
jgi:hypothetical protein